MPAWRSSISALREGALGVVRRQHVEQALQDRLGVADQRDRRLVQTRAGSSGSASTRMIVEVVVDAPLLELESACVPTPSTTSASPHSSRPSGRVTLKRIAAVEHAAAAPVAEHRRLQHGATAR